jgi:leucyl/phenylalanyl-tRNA--protein transferase
MTRLAPSRYFPPAETAGPEGLIGFGGRLTPSWLLDAYRHGIFPWPMGDEESPTPWWSPDPRAIFEFDRFHVSRRLARTCRSGRFDIGLDRDFAGVIRGCAGGPGRVGNTWLTPEMIAAYIRLHQLGHAHCVDVRHDGQLAAGVYGVAVGALFAAESMFTRVRDASKAALVYLMDHLRLRGYTLVDIQVVTPHTARFGAVEIPRSQYLERLAHALQQAVTFSDAPSTSAPQAGPAAHRV